MKRSSTPIRLALALMLLAVLGAAPFVLRALWASEMTAPVAAISATEDPTEADSTNQLALAPAIQADTPQTGSPRVARQNAPEKPAERPKNAQTAADPFQVPEGTADELIEFIIQVQKVKAKGMSEEARMQNTTRIAGAVVTAAERVLVQKPSDEQAEAVANVAFQALWHLVGMDDETALPRIDKLITQLEKDQRPALANLALQNSLLRRIAGWEDPTAEQKAAFAADFHKFITATPLDQSKLQLAMNVGEMLEQLGDTQTAVSVYQSLIGVLPKTEQAQEFVSRMEAIVRRLDLPGKFMDIQGTTLAGKAFDWNSYRGKVVLIDFWATWCGPCIKELPNVIENYRKYHDQGFEVVGISLDEDKRLVEEFQAERKIPWVTLLEKNPDLRGWNNPLVEKYGISGIPAAILVDKEGKVVSLAAHGEELEEQLIKLLGPAKASAK